VLVIVGAVGEDAIGASARTTGEARHRRDGIQQREQLQDVVAVAGA
jgi:hypothetical protein